jgi:hypothetical protein
MGDARRRGTFEERKRQAMAAGRVKAARPPARAGRTVNPIMALLGMRIERPPRLTKAEKRARKERRRMGVGESK